jgi:hypothetical protein
MQREITDDEIVAALLLPLSPVQTREEYEDYMRSLADAVMQASRKEDGNDSLGETDATGHAAVRQTGDMELA